MEIKRINELGMNPLSWFFHIMVFSFLGYIFQYEPFRLHQGFLLRKNYRGQADGHSKFAVLKQFSSASRIQVGTLTR